MFGDQQQPWTPHQIRTAAELWHINITDIFDEDEFSDGAKARTFELIAARVGRSIPAVRARWQMHGESFNRRSGVSRAHNGRSIPQEVIIERFARADGADMRDLTGALMGDPPVGFSMLDRRRV